MRRKTSSVARKDARCRERAKLTTLRAVIAQLAEFKIFLFGNIQALT
jgi:hypothetical protein